MPKNPSKQIIFVVGFSILLFALANCGKTEIQTQAQTNCEGCGAADAPKNVSWQTRIAAESEPGEPMLISGTIYKPDGKTPAEGVLLYVYHTDAKGYYKTRENEHQHGRLRGWMRTGADGRYEFRSIKPASYPNSTAPAHIHPTVSGAGYAEYWIDEYWFVGDKFIPEADAEKFVGLGDFSPIVKLEKDADGVWRGVRNIKLKEKN